jgi:site-specific DNA-methyltransferase (cytosine-N4-specific)
MNLDRAAGCEDLSVGSVGVQQSLPMTPPAQLYYRTSLGNAYHGDSIEFMRSLPKASIDLVLTSPPFALKRKKQYGNEDEDRYCDWFMAFAPDLRRVLKEDGSFVLDLGGAYMPGFPVRSIYMFELVVRLVKEAGFFLAQEFFHYNPARLPAPAEWVNVRRIRVKDSVNMVFWLSKSQNPNADNRRVLKAYSDSMKDLLRNGYKAKLRPSGHDISTKFARDNGGAIPPNLLELPNTESNSAYQRMCREAGLPVHPARFPAGFAEFFIKFLTEPGDVVFDPFAGSNTTGWVAENLQRKWISCELNPEYVEGSILRFDKGAVERCTRVEQTSRTKAMKKGSRGAVAHQEEAA